MRQMVVFQHRLIVVRGRQWISGAHKERVSQPWMVYIVNDGGNHDSEAFEFGDFRSRLCQFNVAEGGVRDVKRVCKVVVRI